MEKKYRATYQPIYAYQDYAMNFFLRIPKELLESEDWQHLSITAIVVYSLLLERALASKDNEFFHDEEGYPFVYYAQADLAKILRVSLPKVRRVLYELEGAELIHRKHQFLTKPDMIYVNDYGSPIVVPYGQRG